MDAMTRIERSLLRSLELAQGIRGAPLAARGDALCGVSGRCADSPAALPRGRARLRATGPASCAGGGRGHRAPALRLARARRLAVFRRCGDSAGPAVGARAFGERIAVLTGDALIVLAFQSLAMAGAGAPARLCEADRSSSRAPSARPGGIIAGQAWECEPQVALASYQRAKTGALFAAATAAGACAAGYEGEAWHALGERLGEAYQIADDIRDVVSDPERTGQAHRARPGARASQRGAPLGDRSRGCAPRGTGRAAVEAIPACPGASDLRAHIRSEASRLLPRELARPAA